MIVRIKKEINFSIISNEPLHDKRLSYGARGVLAYLLTLPSNWNVNMSHLISNSNKDGRDKVTGLFSELLELGYAERTEIREKGRFKGYEYTVYEKPTKTENTESVQKTETGLSHTVSPKTETPKTVTPKTVTPKTEKAETENRTLISTNSNKDLKEINTKSNNTLLPVFSKNEQASEIESLNAKIERLESLLEQMEKRNTAEGAERNNVAKTELGDLSASIGVSYVNTQEDKDKSVKATKTRNKGNILIENDANFQSLSIFEQKWNESMQAKYPNLCPQLVYEWFVPAVQAKYNGTYKDHFAALRTWLGRASDSEIARLCKNKPTEQYNNEGLINDMIQRTKGQLTTMQKLDSMLGEDFDNFVKSRK